MPGLTLAQNVDAAARVQPRGARGRGRSARASCSTWSASATAPTALPRELSAGQQQRVVIARALVNRPTLLLADEPSSDLDEDTEDEIMEIFSRVHAEQGLTIIMVTHARNLIPFGTRHLEMGDGTVRADGVAAAGNGD